MKLITIGCSFTEGQGLKNHINECYSNLLAEKLKLQYYNFGLCGASNDYVFRKILELIESNDITKEDIIVIQWTHYNRKELPIVYNDRNWYHYAPNTHFPMADKKLFKNNQNISVKNQYTNEDTHNDVYEIKNKNSKLLNSYTFNFLHDVYQKNTTKNYIKSLYTYLEHFGYKHLHFFGWKNCVIDSIIHNNPLFLQDNFGEFTNTIGNEHPDKEGHLNWSEHLYQKIKENNYI
jgi:hypothetical protein